MLYGWSRPVGGSAIKPLFTRGPVPGYRMLLCAVLSLALMFAEDRFSWMVDVRASMATLVSPVQWVVSLPTEGISWGALVFADQQELADAIAVGLRRNAAPGARARER